MMEKSESNNTEVNERLDNLEKILSQINVQFNSLSQYIYTIKPAKPKKEKVDYGVDENEERGNWSGKFDFFLACLGYAVGLGNVWRFPYICYSNGGAVFFIPYVIMLVFVGMPIFFMELSLGQYTSQGPMTCWDMAKMFKGVGIGMCIISAIVSIYYNMIIAWAFYYLFASFTSDLPWGHCDREWNTQLCSTLLTDFSGADDCNMKFNAMIDGGCYDNNNTLMGIYNTTLADANKISKQLPSEQFMNYKMFGMENDPSKEATSLDNVGPIHWQLVLCLLLSWIVVSLSLIKGVKSSGKVVYFTALFPYAVLIILFCYGMTLEGMEAGIEMYIMKIDWKVLQSAKVWKDAAVQIFFSLSASWGGLIALSSYNRFHNNVLRDSLLVSLGNCLTSFFAGFVIFSFIGFLAHKTNQPVNEVAGSGAALAFIIYPMAVLELPAPPFWAILFFGMLITLGLDSEFALVETVTTCITDQCPYLRKKKGWVIVIYACIMFLLGLPLCTSAGPLFLDFIDASASSWNITLISLMECICISYVYGVFRFKEDIRLMIGAKGCGIPWNWCFPWWALNWCFLTPLGVVFVMVFYWIDPTKLEPKWADDLGMMISLLVVITIIGAPVYYLIVTPGSFTERVRVITKPSEYWGPALKQHRQLVEHIPDFVIDPYEGTTSPVLTNEIKVIQGKSDISRLDFYNDGYSP